ncbi:MAG: hypothetical protein IKU41_06480 [Clostridia bacterium]|nr:hypothetical protein [Clostridia bacterium]
MSVAFLKLFNMSITASWLILFVLLVRIILKKAPNWTKCLLWGFVGLRLVFPFSIESILSLVPSAEIIPPSNLLSTAPPQIDSGFATINQAVNPFITETYAEHGNQFPSLISVFSVIWIIGLTIMLIYGVVSYSTLYVKVRVSIKYKENIYLCDNIDSTFILGIVKPKIYIPSGYSDEQMEYIIAHEKSHLKRKDHWWKPIGFALLSVYWFNPLIWISYILLCRDIELACDEKVIKDMGTADMKGYSETLLNCSSTHRRVLVCPLAFGEISVKGRVKAMLNYKRPAFWVVAVAVTSCVIIATCFLTNPQKSENTDSSNNPSGVVEDSTNKNTETSTQNDENNSSESTSENESTKETVKTESTTKNGETTTKKPVKPNTTGDKNATNSKIKYVTDSSVMLKIDNVTMFGPQYSYIAVTSPKLKDDAYFKNSVIKYYNTPAYFDSSVTDASAMNKSIEIQKEFYWIDQKMNSLGLELGSVTWGGGSSLSADERTAHDHYLVGYFAKENMLIPALVKNGTLKISESERNKVIRNGCSSDSYIKFEYPIDLPQDIVDEEISFIRTLFGSDGINSYEEFYKAQDIIAEREQAIADKMGYGSHYNPIHYTVDYYQDEWYEPGLGVDQSLYNVIQESHTTFGDEKTFFIKINYDPVDHLNLDEANAKEVLIESARPAYIAYKKKGVDQLTVTLNKDNYIRQISHYR